MFMNGYCPGGRWRVVKWITLTYPTIGGEKPPMPNGGDASVGSVPTQTGLGALQRLRRVFQEEMTTK